MVSSIGEISCQIHDTARGAARRLALRCHSQVGRGRFHGILFVGLLRFQHLVLEARGRAAVAEVTAVNHIKPFIFTY